MRAYYFGSLGGGHHWYAVDGSFLMSIRPNRFDGPWSTMDLDAGTQPGCVHNQENKYYKVQENEGEALLHHKDGWTLISMWDRSGDSRPGSHSNFILEGIHGWNEAIQTASQIFPDIFRRFKFTIRQVGLNSVQRDKA